VRRDVYLYGAADLRGRRSTWRLWVHCELHHLRRRRRVWWEVPDRRLPVRDLYGWFVRVYPKLPGECLRRYQRVRWDVHLHGAARDVWGRWDTERLRRMYSKLPGECVRRYQRVR